MLLPTCMGAFSSSSMLGPLGLLDADSQAKFPCYLVYHIMVCTHTHTLFFPMSPIIIQENPVLLTGQKHAYRNKQTKEKQIRVTCRCT